MNLKPAIPCIASLKSDASIRDKILTAANEILLTIGFTALTQQAVAARAGVRQSHLTYYFPTRNDLLRETAQFGVEAMFLPMAETAVRGEISVHDLRELLMPDKTDRQWFRLMTGLASASEEDASIRRWMRELDARILEKLKAGFALVGVPISEDHANFLHATFVGALQLDMVDPSDESFERVSRSVATALNVVLPSTPTPTANPINHREPGS